MWPYILIYDVRYDANYAPQAPWFYTIYILYYKFNSVLPPDETHILAM